MRSILLAALLASATMTPLRSGADGIRSLDGGGNNLNQPVWGQAGEGMIRFGYSAHFLDGNGAMITDEQRANPRDISNAIFAQSASVKSARGLSDLSWAWGQFITHDMELVTTDAGPEVNGVAPIAINDPQDPLGPNPIPFVRADWIQPSGRGAARTPINHSSSYLDASVVYGLDADRAAALRSAGGKLLEGPAALLPTNAAGLAVENHGPFADTQLFLAGDIRANENPLLTSLQTVFVREHNRLVDRIATEMHSLDDEGRYQLARKLVGAEIQAITYNEYLPALLGEADAPKASEHTYLSGLNPSITNAFAQAAFRLGHSQVSGEMLLIDSGGEQSTLSLRNAFYNPTLLGDDPSLVDALLRGASRQAAEEIDTQMVDDLRNALFGPPGAGGLDLAAINIQRGRDVGLPNYNSLRRSHGLSGLSAFDQATSDSELAEALSQVYVGNLENTDAWVGGLAEDHLLGASVGPLFTRVIQSQFTRLRDGDRFFYTGGEAGLYVEGELDPAIAALVDLDAITLGDLLAWNTGAGDLHEGVFFVPGAEVMNEGDFNHDGRVDAADYTVWRDAQGAGLDAHAYDVWQVNFGRARVPIQSGGGRRSVAIPAPGAGAMAALLTAMALACGGRTGLRRAC